MTNMKNDNKTSVNPIQTSNIYVSVMDQNGGIIYTNVPLNLFIDNEGFLRYSKNATNTPLESSYSLAILGKSTMPIQVQIPYLEPMPNPYWTEELEEYYNNNPEWASKIDNIENSNIREFGGGELNIGDVKNIKITSNGHIYSYGNTFTFPKLTGRFEDGKPVMQYPDSTTDFMPEFDGYDTVDPLGTIVIENKIMPFCFQSEYGLEKIQEGFVVPTMESGEATLLESDNYVSLKTYQLIDSYDNTFIFNSDMDENKLEIGKRYIFNILEGNDYVPYYKLGKINICYGKRREFDNMCFLHTINSFSKFNKEEALSNNFLFMCDSLGYAIKGTVFNLIDGSSETNTIINLSAPFLVTGIDIIGYELHNNGILYAIDSNNKKYKYAILNICTFGAPSILYCVSNKEQLYVVSPNSGEPDMNNILYLYTNNLFESTKILPDKDGNIILDINNEINKHYK